MHLQGANGWKPTLCSKAEDGILALLSQTVYLSEICGLINCNELMRIYLVGFMGAGKSTYGKKLANQLKIPFHDTDELISAKTEKTISQLFADEGEEAFRVIEQQVLHETASLGDAVIATGGGLAPALNNMEWMKAEGKTVYLKLLEQKLFNRLAKSKDPRPLLDGMDKDELRQFVHDKLTERGMVYMKADYVIQPEQFTPKQLAAEFSGASLD